MTQKLPNKRYAVRVTAGDTTYLIPDSYADNLTPLLLTKEDALRLADKYSSTYLRSEDNVYEPVTSTIEEFRT